ncbi:MAG TPA: hypothetical protein VIH61_04235 [Waddliaceae bacterium]
MRFTLLIMFAFMSYAFRLPCAELPFVKNLEKDQRVEIVSDSVEIHVDSLPENQKFQPRIAPLLSLTKEYPITIDSNNRMRLEAPQRDLEEAKHNIDLWRQKTFPWKGLLTVLLFASIVMMIKLKQKNLKSVFRNQMNQELNAQKKGMQALEVLRNLLKKQNYEEFYLQITDIVRCFIEERFQIKTSIKTTQEFLQEMAQYPELDSKTQTLLSDFLLRADKVKFADHSPSYQECEEAYKAAETLMTYSNT